jgi:dipeptidyl aminopeptidase/acylaminoacyl peptidase
MKVGPSAVLLTLLLSSACTVNAGTGSSPSVGQGSRHVLPIHTGDFSDLTWLPSGWLIISYDPNPSKPGRTTEVWRLRPSGSEFARIPIPSDSSCWQTVYLFPAALQDGRFALTKHCVASPGTLPDSQISVIIADVQGSNIETLAPPPLTINPGSKSWSQSANRGVADYGSSICENIIWLTRAGIEAIPVTVGDGVRSWRLDDPRLSDPTQCGDPHLGRAEAPAWSGDGKMIAFLGSPNTIGLRGQQRLGASWNLYLMDPGNLQLRKVLEGIRGGGSLTWSPDSRSLAFSSEVEAKGSGTWIVAASDGALQRVGTDTLSSLSFSPDGKQIAGILDGGSLFPPKAQIIILDLPH